MEWFVVVLVVAVIGIAAVAAAGKLGQMSPEPIRDVYQQDLPDEPLVAHDIETVKFAVTFRGYAMSQVDDLLERLGREIGDRDRRIAELSGSTLPPAPSPEPVEGPPSVAPPTLRQAQDANREYRPDALDRRQSAAGGGPPTPRPEPVEGPPTTAGPDQP